MSIKSNRLNTLFLNISCFYSITIFAISVNIASPILLEISKNIKTDITYMGIIISVSLRVYPLNRKKEFADLKLLPSAYPEIKTGNNPKIGLNRKIKKLLDPQGVFVDLF